VTTELSISSGSYVKSLSQHVAYVAVVVAVVVSRIVVNVVFKEDFNEPDMAAVRVGRIIEVTALFTTVVVLVTYAMLAKIAAGEALVVIRGSGARMVVCGVTEGKVIHVWEGIQKS